MYDLTESPRVTPEEKYGKSLPITGESNSELVKEVYIRRGIDTK